MIQFALAVALTLAGPTPLQLQDRSPRSLDVVALRSSPRNPRLTLAINEAGEVLRSSDAGLTFSATSLAVPTAINAQIQFDAGGVAYVSGSGTSVWVSRDSGVNWIQRLAPGAISSVRTSPHRPLEIWCGNQQGEIFKSVDAAASWTPLGLTLSGSELWISHDVNLPGTTLVGTKSSTIQYTNDEGLTWNASSVSGSFGAPISISNRWFALSFYLNHAGGFYDINESSPTASGWTLFSYFSAQEISRRPIMADPSDPNRIIVIGKDEVRVLDVVTSNWDILIDIQDGVRTNAVAFPQDDPNRLLVSTDLGVIEGLRDNGLSRISSGNAGNEPLSAFTISVNPNDAEHLVSQSASGHILESFDGGDRWEIADGPFAGSSHGFPYGSEVEFDVAGRLLLRGSFDPTAIWRRMDGVWTPLAPSSNNLTLTAFGGLIGSPELLVVSTAPYQVPNLTVSKDGGTTWSLEPIVLDHPNGIAYDSVHVADIHVSEGPSPEPRIVLTGWNYGALGNNIGWFVAYTDDLGVSYTVAASDYRRIVLAASPRNPERIALGFESLRPTEFSTDGLATLTVANRPVSTLALAVGSITDGLLVRSDFEARTFESKDWGNTWTPVMGVPVGLPFGFGIAMRDGEEGYLVGSSAGLWEQVLAPSVSTTFCAPAVVNSTGQPATLIAQGSDSIGDDFIRLDARQLPPSATTLFLASTASGFVAQPGGSFGNLCLAGAIGRYHRDIRSAGLGGSASLVLDPNALAQPNGSLPALAGVPWYFQAWFRDNVAGQATSNFTDGCRIDWVQ